MKGSRMGYSQFGGLTGDIESSVRTRNGWASLKRSGGRAQAARRRRRVLEVAVILGLALLVAFWVLLVSRVLLNHRAEPVGHTINAQAENRAAVSGPGNVDTEPGKPAAEAEIKVETKAQNAQLEKQVQKSTGVLKRKLVDCSHLPPDATNGGGCVSIGHMGWKGFMMMKPYQASLGEDAYTGYAGNTLALMRRLFETGKRDPAELLRLLEEEDPLGVNLEDLGDFKCPPPAEQLSAPGGVDQRNHTVEEEFRAGRGFLYYQHLRKAGGTGFCDMAFRNMEKKQVPKYYCMPDNRGAMATPPYSNPGHLVSVMKKEGFRITANEWDAFPESHLDIPGAVFATTFRHPVDRWYSQYRFEHLEHRDGTREGDVVKPFLKWYKGTRNSLGNNYYIKTFCGAENPSTEAIVKHAGPKGVPYHKADLYWSYHKFMGLDGDPNRKNFGDNKLSWEHFARAIGVLLRFNLVLVLEFVEDHDWALRDVLGWTKSQNKVLPDARHSKLENRSSKAKGKLSAEEWELATQSNTLDILLFTWAKRVYLERRMCGA